MHNTLIEAAKWLEQQGIRTMPGTDHLLVRRADAAALITEAELLLELRVTLATKKLFWGNSDSEWLRLGCF